MEPEQKSKKPHSLKKFLLSYRSIPNKKPYVEFLTALLSIPVLLTVIVLNINSLRTKDKQPENTKETIYVTSPGSSNQIVTKDPSHGPCKAELGPVDISSPQEKETVTDTPVSLVINYQQGDYCAAVWSYRINGGKWSEYDDKSIALYDVPSGNVKVDVRVKSVVNGKDAMLTRNFIYKGDTNQPTPVASSSAN